MIWLLKLKSLIGAKGKILAVLLILSMAAGGGWMVRGWLEGSRHAAELEAQRQRFMEELEQAREQQREDDRKALRVAQELQVLRSQYQKLKREARNVVVTEVDCRSDVGELERMWNDANKAAGDPQPANAKHGTVPAPARPGAPQ